MKMAMILISFIGFTAMILVTTLGCTLVPGYAESKIEEMNQED